MKGLKAFFGGSKKATAVLIGVGSVLAKNFLNIDEATLNALIAILMTYVGGQSVVDAALVWKGNKTE